MKVAIIGARQTRYGIGQYIAKYFQQNGARVIAVLGTTPQTSAQAAFELVKYGITATPYIDFTEMLETQQPDALVIASPGRTHYEYLLKCVQAGLSVFCEKPFIHPEQQDLQKDLAYIFQIVQQKKLTVAMNSQWSFALEAYERLVGPIGNPSEFYIKMSPPAEGKEMIPEAIPHVLSILYCGMGKGEIENLSFYAPSLSELEVKFNYLSSGVVCGVLIKLSTQTTHPREFSFGFNGKIVQRIIDLKDYSIYLNYRDTQLKIIDPLELSVKDFIRAFKEKKKPLVGPGHILNNMYLLQKIYTSCPYA